MSLMMHVLLGGHALMPNGLQTASYEHAVKASVLPIEMLRSQ